MGQSIAASSSKAEPFVSIEIRRTSFAWNPDVHVVIFDSWADSRHTHYNAYEESPYYGQVNYTTNIPYPYWSGYDTSDYVPMRLNSLSNPPTPVSSPSPSIVLPGGMWADPSPKNGETVSDVIHFAAQAYPTHSGDPAFAHVNFTLGSQGTWKVVLQKFLSY